MDSGEITPGEPFWAEGRVDLRVPRPDFDDSTAAWYMFGAPSTLYCWAMLNSTRLSSRTPTVLLLRPSDVPFSLTTETELP